MPGRIGNLKKRLDKIFSEYVRLRDSDGLGMGLCCTCGKRLHWKSGDCGHFVPRKNSTCRYDEVNCNLQCRPCNRGLERNASYAEFIIRNYGEHELRRLKILEHQTKHFSEEELLELIEKYKLKLENLRSTK
jgi:hypothetical protein